MKKAISITLLFMAFASYSQNYKADTLNVSDLSVRCTEFKNYNAIQYFVLDNGFIIYEGLKVRVTEPATSRFEFQTLLRGNITTAAALGSDANLHRNFAGKEYVVKKIFVTHSGMTRESALRVGVNIGVEGGNGAAASSQDLISSINTGELEIIGLLTREQAISKMLETKELYDAGFLTEEEFEAKKAELRKFVK
ncbi:MAG: SHOCT domain-containing protein [Bacteroidetes bacterium]|nr:SHOCT domain-containing protein [Bacteroidota bacterium]